MKRLHPGFNVDADCIVTNTFPMRESDPPGLYLGKDSAGNNVYITYWTALEIAMMVGFPPLEVVEQLQKDYDQLTADYKALNNEFDDRVLSHIDNRYIRLLAETKGEILAEQKRATRSIRYASKFGTDPDASRTAKLGGGEGSSSEPRGADSKPSESAPDGSPVRATKSR